MRLTDPAKELSDFCNALATGESVKGDIHLARAFEVDAWSAEFMLILNAFMERTEIIKATLKNIEIDEDQLAELEGHIKTLQSLCSMKVLAASWNNSDGGLPIVKGASRAAIHSLSLSIRPLISYPSLEEEERAEVLEQVNMILGKLVEFQKEDPDFIRQALIDGLLQFRMRLSRLKWIGWGYAIEGLREVILAYLVLEQKFPDPNENPPAAAILRLTKGLLEKIWKYGGYAAGANSRLDVAVLAFKTTRIAAPYIAGLLTGAHVSL